MPNVADPWETLLTQLETDVAAVERLLAPPAYDVAHDDAQDEDRLLEELARSSWSAPATMPPLPAAYVGRARSVEARQRQVVQRLTVTLAETARQRHAVVNGYGAVPAAAPLYLDQSA